MIFITGDTHCPFDISKLKPSYFPKGQTLTKTDYVIICGDFGAVWDDTLPDRFWRKWLDKQPWTTLFVDGNHENFDLLNEYPVSYWHGGKVHMINSSVIHLMRGQIFEIDGATFFTFGGGYSQDLDSRIEHRSWWQEELPNTEELNEAWNNLILYNFKVDYIITHDCPYYIKELLHTRMVPCDLSHYTLPHLRNIDEVMEDIEEHVEYKKWFSGHLHIDQAIYKHIILFNNIIQLER